MPPAIFCQPLRAKSHDHGQAASSSNSYRPIRGLVSRVAKVHRLRPWLQPDVPFGTESQAHARDVHQRSSCWCGTNFRRLFDRRQGKSADGCGLCWGSTGFPGILRDQNEEQGAQARGAVVQKIPPAPEQPASPQINLLQLAPRQQSISNNQSLSAVRMAANAGFPGGS